MTTDKFAEAAREEARRYHWELREDGDLYYPPLDFGQHMAEWARTHLAAQEPTDAEVEAAAKAQYRNPDGWDLVLAAYRKRVAEVGPIPSHVIAHRLELARDALLAARAVRRDEATR